MNAETWPEKRRTPSETLMAALEGIDDCEEAMIIKINAEGSIEWCCTTDSIHKKLGMVSAVRECIVHQMFE